MLSYYFQVALHNTRRNKALTMLMILAIAVGIGASMTTLTVMQLLSGDPLPGRSQHLYYPQVDVSPKSKGREPLDVLDYRTAMDLWSARQADQQTLVANSQVKLRAPDTALPPLMLAMTSTTADFFSMFNVPFKYGKGWSQADDAARARVAVISASLNDKLFGGGDSVGRVIRLGDADVRIAGVLAPWRPFPLFYQVRGGRFANGDTSGFYGKTEDVFTPFSTSLDVNPGNFQPFTCWASPEQPGHLEQAPCVWVALWVRLDSPAKVAAYRHFLQNYATQQKAQGRIKHADNTRLRSLMQWLDFNRVVPSDTKLQTALAFAFLAICLTNVLSLLSAKFLRHSAETGLRRALGATRGSVFAQCMAESAIIGVLGGAMGLLLTLLGLSLVRRQPVPYADGAYLDLTMFLWTFALSLLVSLLAGMLPALRATLIQPATQLKTL
ncbi:putative ABC transport system permease protein [Duganella sacchari]|uniref:Putative ABC transport system permease protein n=1 Tax=Duganella sacchari TaxID=551987 RepID=A0A1M7MV33_9BURK|nr:MULTISPECIES: ABC transporter permease [Duganella]MYM29465.1 FtsX-like permease family protein [Duganella sp. CY15W]SHM94878.1 putative ABC transport system permease protein [Duganella sacchari]